MLFGKTRRWVILLSCLTASPSAAARAQSTDDLQQMSIEDLAHLEISSVSKSDEPLNTAPAAVYVITHDDIVRSGAIGIPDILRLAPNLQIAQINANTYAISARGFNSQLADKLLVLIDGRSTYSPLYAGVYWDMQDVLVEDIDRVEVISGPGSTLWGANAVNGVINIITKKSSDTQGGVLELGGGNFERSASLQYGGRLSDDLTYRVYAKGMESSARSSQNGANARDGWSKPQGGFRLDWTPDNESVMLQGDIYHSTEQQISTPNQSISGRDVLARWQHELGDGSVLQIQTYYDQTKRSIQDGNGGFVLNTYDLDIQHSFSLGSWNDIVWGGGGRIAQYEIGGIPNLSFVPDRRTLVLSQVFAQDTLSLTGALKLTVGLKLEDDPFTRLAPLPSGRLSWKITEMAQVWSAVSRALRAPTPFDDDLVEKIAPSEELTGSSTFQSETLTAYELGTRLQPSAEVSFSVSTFYNVYDDLRSVEYAGNGAIYPLHLGNLMAGHTYGVEVWGDYRATNWWRLTASVMLEREALHFRAGSSGLGGIALAGDDPKHQLSLRSSMDLADGVTFDADLREIGALPSPAISSYTELNARLGWKISKSVEISLSGFNLLHAHHLEFAEPPIADEVPRSVFIDTRWRF